MTGTGLLRGARLAGLLAGLSSALFIAGCPGCPQKPSGVGPASPPDGAPPLLTTPQGVPVVRVLVASGPTLKLATTGGFRLFIDEREVDRSLAAMPETDVSCDGAAWQLSGQALPRGRLIIEGIGRSCVRLGAALYRDQLVLHFEGGTIYAVNHVQIESYLAGVLARELLPGWHEQAYAAQAIAARTYALYERGTFGREHSYDVRDDQGSQVYGGVRAETDTAWQAVRRTDGLVLAYGPPDRERIFKTYFSSTCGGLTNSAYVLSGPPISTGPLAGGVVCTDCQRAPRYRWPSAKIPKATIFQAAAHVYPAVAALDSVKSVEVTEEIRGVPVWLNLVSPDGRKVLLRASDLRLCLLREGAGKELYSFNCQISDAGSAVVFANGRGFGHSVGLCQWGAQGMAERGCSFQEILLKYYPGARIFKAY